LNFSRELVLKSYTEVNADMALERETGVDEIFSEMRRCTRCILPETLDVGSNVLVGTNPDKIVARVKLMLGKKNDWANPFRDGKSDERIIEILRHEFD
jgi:hypothetical protein